MEYVWCFFYLKLTFGLGHIFQYIITWKILVDLWCKAQFGTWRCILQLTRLIIVYVILHFCSVVYSITQIVQLLKDCMYLKRLCQIIYIFRQTRITLSYLDRLFFSLGIYFFPFTFGLFSWWRWTWGWYKALFMTWQVKYSTTCSFLSSIYELLISWT